ncbi:hypothetical protein CEB3_c31640 [Peptococcaceae bacterium CEB3]|nr:hypothetical protein CEB3_c31640 [Peptococcaceae bacterium CEB3]
MGGNPTKDPNIIRLIKRFLKAGAMESELKQFGLELSEEKSKIIALGRNTGTKDKGEGRPGGENQKPSTF